MKKHMPVPDNLVADPDMKTAIDTRGLSIRSSFPREITADYVRSEVKKAALHDPFLPDPDDPFHPQPIAPERQPLFKRGREGGVIPEMLTGADEEIRRVLREHGVQDQDEIDQGKRVFVRSGGESLPAEVFRSGNDWVCRVNGRRFLGSSREDAMTFAAQELQRDDRQISDDQRLEIYRVAQIAFAHQNNPRLAREQISVALDHYCQLRTGLPMSEAVLRHQYVPICNEATLFVWSAINPDFQIPDDWESFVDRFASHRPLSISLLDGARAAYEKQRDDKDFNRVLNGSAGEWMEELRPQPPTEEELNDLDDDSVRELMKNIRKEAARN